MTTTTKQEMRALIANAVKGTVQIGNVMQIVLGSTTDHVDEIIQVMVSKGLKAGKTVRRDDGSREWIAAHEIIDHSKVGGAAYTWHADGNRVKHERVHVIIDADGNRTETVVGTTYRKFE